MELITCFTHGEAKGDPGAAAIGVRILDEKGTVLHEAGQLIGNGTDDYAAYQAVMSGLDALTLLLGEETTMVQIELKLNNKVVYQQLSAKTPINDPGLVPLFIAIHNLSVTHFPQLTYTLVSVEENDEVVILAQAALDGK